MPNHPPPNPRQVASDEYPHSPEAEEAVIGAILINPFVLDDLHHLKVDDFYVHRLRFVWEAYQRLSARNAPIDSLTVSQELDDMGRLDEIGGPAYLTSLLNQCPTTLNVDAYAEIMQACTYRRRVIESAARQAQIAFDESAPLVNVMGTIQKEKDDLIQFSPNENGGDLRQSLSRVYDKIEARSKLPTFQPVGYSTGWSDLDLIIDGLQTDCYSIVAALRGVGKTAFMLCMALATARAGVPTAFYSREMSRERVIYRLIAQMSGINSRLLKHGAFPGPDEHQRYLDAYAELERLPLRIFSPQECRSVEQIDASGRKLKAQGELELAFVDYAQILSTSQNKSGNREQEVAAISRTLAGLRDIEIGVIAAAQVGRDVEKSFREPMLSDLRESGALENDADTVIFLHSPDPTGAPQSRDVIVAKNRDGDTGRVNMYFDAGKMSFFQTAKQPNAQRPTP
jgi:replicative DNA helicase